VSEEYKEVGKDVLLGIAQVLGSALISLIIIAIGKKN
jgi:hypothetical protein